MVRWIGDNSGRFIKRPYYDAKELDDECERIVSQFLLDTKGRVSFPFETDELTVLVERMTSDLDLYADLSQDGVDVEGVTRFTRAQRPAIAIATALTENDRRHNRLRTTLSHELGHVRLHDDLFQAKLATQDMFAPARDEKIVCKRDRMIDAPFSDWMEWQACYASGAFLMPKSALIGVVAAWRRERDVQGTISSNDQHGLDLIEMVRMRFATSAEAARVRMLKLGILVSGSKAPTLFD